MGCRAAVPDQRLEADRPQCEPATDWRPVSGTARVDVQSRGRIALPTFFWGGLGPPRRRRRASPLAWSLLVSGAIRRSHRIEESDALSYRDRDS